MERHSNRQQFQKKHVVLQRGFATGLALTLLLYMSTVALAVFGLSSVLSSTAGRSGQKIQATQMAEAGANALYAQISAGFDSNPASPTWPSTLSSSSVSSTVSGSTTADGSYTAHIVNTPTAATVSGKTVYTFVVEGDGVAPNGVLSSQVRLSFTETSSGTAGGTYAFPNGAVVSNGPININNGASTLDNAGNHLASIESNTSASVYWGSTVDGTVQVPSSAVASSQAADYTGTVTALSAPIAFPSSGQLSTWQSAWLANAEQHTTTYPSGNINTTASLNGTNTITVPAYYSGDFTLNYGTTTLQPDTTANAPYVLYVHGNINIAGGGTLINNGAIIVCDGQINIANGTTYQVNNMTTSAMIDLNSSSTTAVTLAGGTVVNIGLIYAPNGGITLNNNANLTGSIISGSAAGSVAMAGGGKVIYPDGLASTVGFIPSSGNYTSSLATSYFREL